MPGTPRMREHEPGTGCAASPPVPGEPLEFSAAHDGVPLSNLADDELVAELARCAAQRRHIDARTAVISAEIARRSQHELGHDGLAQRAGLSSGLELVQRVAGATAREARSLVEVGALLADPVQRGGAVATAVAGGSLPIEAARVIREGLGEPNAQLDGAALESAAVRLVALATASAPSGDDAPPLAIERLAARARAERDALDIATVAEREAARHARRYLALTPTDDGMTRIHGLLDPESAALVRAAFDRVTSPRRGGPRFVDESERRRAAATIDDPRTTGQLALDAFVQMVKLATDADPGELFGRWQPGVRVHVSAEALATGSGIAHLEGETAAVSVATATRVACEQGTVTIAFDGQASPIDVGREQRLYTRRQRIALAARDGGCRFPGCDRPPSWCEAHHITPWSEGGATELREGVLLCRFHHLNVHNHGYRIRRDGTDYWLEPPDLPRPLSPPGYRRGEIPMPSRWQPTFVASPTVERPRPTER